MARFAGLLAVCTLVACGGSSPVSGTIHGQQLQVGSSLSVSGFPLEVVGSRTSCSAATDCGAQWESCVNGYCALAGTGRFLALASAPGLCAELQHQTEPARTRWLELLLIDRDSADGTPRPGTYVVVSRPSAQADLPRRTALVGYYTTDDRCADGPNTISGGATGGTVTVERADGSGTAGSLAVDLETENVTTRERATDHVSGSFAADACANAIPGLLFGENTCH